jgi:hypothetical protein
MRKFFTLAFALGLVASTGFANNFIAVAPVTVPTVVKPVSETPAVTTPVTGRNANTIMIPVGKTGKSISLKELATISKQDLETLRGKEMSGLEKIAFNKTQKRLQKGIDANGNITSKKLNYFLSGKKAGETGFHLGGFAMGFFGGLLGVLIAYVAFDDDFKKNRIKWSWIGCGVSTALWILLTVLVFAAAASTATVI